MTGIADHRLADTSLPANACRVLISGTTPVIMVDVTDTDPPLRESVIGNGWVLVCFGHHHSRGCHARGFDTGPHQHELIIEFDPSRDNHRLFLDHIRRRLRPDISLIGIARGSRPTQQKNQTTATP
jgi:hypothetical protein